MSRLATLLMALAFVAICSTAYALYSVSDTGDWPKSWPPELESLRKQSRTLVGPQLAHRHFAIRFKNREDFEAAWEHLLKVKTDGAPVILVRGKNFFLGDDTAAGVVVHCPPLGQADNPKTPEAPINSSNMRERWMYTSYIELVVDGDIVDLNRIPFPANTPIVDERFEEKSKPARK